jgi:hypothetical protein
MADRLDKYASRGTYDEALAFGASKRELRAHPELVGVIMPVPCASRSAMKGREGVMPTCSSLDPRYVDEMFRYP